MTGKFFFFLFFLIKILEIGKNPTKGNFAHHKSYTECPEIANYVYYKSGCTKARFMKLFSLHLSREQGRKFVSVIIRLQLTKK
jgi:hypothetical protein